MIVNQLIERALRTLGPLTEEQRLGLRSVALVLVSDALSILSNRIAKEDGYRELQKDFSVTPVAGVVNLSSLTGIVFDIARSRIRVASSGVPVNAVDSLETLVNAGLPADAPLYAQDGMELRFRDTNGAMGAYVTPIKIKSSYILTVDVVPVEHEAALVQTLSGLIGNQMSEIRAREQAAMV